jgi:hypothetical protein
MANCKICGNKLHWWARGAIIGWCDNCYAKIEYEQKYNIPFPSGSAVAPPVQQRREKHRIGRVVYVVLCFLVVAVALLVAWNRSTATIDLLMGNPAYSIEQLKADLQSGDYTVQYKAIGRLVKVKGDRAVDLLIDAAKSESVNVRNEAFDALVKIGGDHATDGLFDLLKNPDSNIQYGAAYALSRIGSPALERLVALVDGTDKGLRAKAAYALAGMKDPLAAARLNTAFKQ